MNAIWLIALPLIAALLLPVIYQHSQSVGRAFLPTVLLVNLVITALLWQHLGYTGAQYIIMGGFPIPLGIAFYVDALALLFVTLLILGTALLWLGKPRVNIREEVILLVMVAAGCGLVLSGDLFNIYVFYEILAVASYGLAASGNSGAGYAASLRYLILGSLGSSLMLLGITLMYALTGTLNLAHFASFSQQLNTPIGLVAFVLILIGLGVKAELFPVNTWVSEVYTTAPVRIAALLGGIVSKLAFVVILRLLVLVYTDSHAHLLLLAMGTLGVLTGELAALRSSHLRQVFAYSSIGQLGLVAIAFSIPTEAGVLAGIAIALHHSLVKSALFMLADRWGGYINHLAGAFHTAKLSTLLFLVLALSLIGIPPLPGFWAKLLLLQAGLSMENAWYHVAIVVVLIATVIETAYFVRILRVLFQPQIQPVAAPQWTELLPALTFSLILFIATINLGNVSHYLGRVATQAYDTQSYLTHR
jgi:formate hydrogenlyase subunit 3/multisubunit Na+/H+ antiporter MnhD subunit